jgi:hypothetical protein
MTYVEFVEMLKPLDRSGDKVCALSLIIFSDDVNDVVQGNGRS